MASTYYKTLTRGQISFTDVADGYTINMYLTANSPLSQNYNQDSDTYTPDWSNSANYLIITPELYISGQTGNQADELSGLCYTISIAAQKFVIGPGSAGALGNNTPATAVTALDEAITGGGRLVADLVDAGGSLTGLKLLRIKSNLTANSMVIECVGGWQKVGWQNPITTKATIAFSRTESAGNAFWCNLTCPRGTTIQPDGDPVVQIHCDAYKGSKNVSSDANWDNLVSFKWYRTNNIDNAPATSAVDGWFEIKSGSNQGALSLYDFNTGTGSIGSGANPFNKADLYLPSDAINVYDRIKCVATDKENPSHPTANDTILVYDGVDDIRVEFSTSDGTSLSSANPKTQISAVLYRNGKALAASEIADYTFYWAKLDSNGNFVNGWVPKNAESQSLAKAYGRGSEGFDKIYIHRTDIENNATIRLEVMRTSDEDAEGWKFVDGGEYVELDDTPTVDATGRLFHPITTSSFTGSVFSNP